MTLFDIEQRERDIAEREGIPYDRCDRVWLRQQAIKSLSVETDATSAAFEQARLTIARLEKERP